MNPLKKFIYMDYAATTPLKKEVLEKMLPYFVEKFGNPSTIYEFGQEARRAIDGARKDIADFLGCAPKEIIFTGSGTESVNFALRGAAEAYKDKGKHIITLKTEHQSVLHTCEYLEKNGFTVTYLDVERDGLVDMEKLKSAIRPDTILISIMLANNEIGVIQDIQKIGEMLKEYRKDTILPLFHTDACQAVGFLDINVRNLGVDLMSFNAGKIYGPKGVGALYIKKGTKLIPQIQGGGQEYRMRAGTENVAAIVGMGEAFKLAVAEKDREYARLQQLRDILIEGIEKNIPKVYLNGHRTKRLPNNVNFSFEGIEGETILLRLDMEGICVSSGSACTSGTVDPSHVLLSIGVPYEIAHGSVRFSLGKDTTQEEVLYVIEKMKEIVADMRAISPLYQ